MKKPSRRIAAMHISTVVSLYDYAIPLYPELISDHLGVTACMVLMAE